MGEGSTIHKEKFSLEELCDACQITPDFLHELIEYGAIEPFQFSEDILHFDNRQLLRVQRVVRLQEDLEVNLPGAALAIDLLEQIDQLNGQMSLLMQHLLINLKD